MTKSFRRNCLILAALAAGIWQQATAQDLGSRLVACAACHGADGNSKTSASPSLAGQPKTFLENQIIMIREGIRVIPAMTGQLDGIPDKEVIALARHFSGQTLKPLDAKRNEGLYKRGEILSRQMLCGTCHLADYKGRDQMPRLAGQREDYLLHSMLQFKNNQAIGRDTIMTASLYGISDDDIKAIAHYLSQLN